MRLSTHSTGGASIAAGVDGDDDPTSKVPRIIYYHQTHYHGGDFVPPLRAAARHAGAHTGLDGLDLDVEEAVSLASIIRLIDRLRTDFGRSRFRITLAPRGHRDAGQHGRQRTEPIPASTTPVLEKAWVQHAVLLRPEIHEHPLRTTSEFFRTGWPAPQGSSSAR
ncbi:hypothetical protein MMC29_007511 [Sticta canariensis]|nr:hypothetical protein [Sticta canariensis]